nr:MAG TPA: endopolygalacturonase [Caudoviricetes sp.]
MADINVNNNYTDMKNLTPFKLCVLQNFPFIEADFDTVTNYQLLCKVVEYLNKVIDNNNKQNNNITQLEQNFITLYNYVKDYFDNLDLQNEINNKIDELITTGEFNSFLSGIYTPEMFGAKGDGVTDDTEAIQKALAFNNVNISKNYLITENLVLHSNLKVFGGGTITKKSEFNDSYLNHSIFSCTNSNNIDINNIVLISNSLAISVHGCSNVNITNLIINSEKYSILISDSEKNESNGITISNIKLENDVTIISSDGIHIDGGCSNIYVTNVSGTSGDDFIALNAIEGIRKTIKNVIIDNIKCSGYAGVRLYGQLNCVIENVSINNSYINSDNGIRLTNIVGFVEINLNAPTFKNIVFSNCIVDSSIRNVFLSYINGSVTFNKCTFVTSVNPNVGLFNSSINSSLIFDSCVFNTNSTSFIQDCVVGTPPENCNTYTNITINSCDIKKTLLCFGTNKKTININNCDIDTYLISRNNPDVIDLSIKDCRINITPFSGASKGIYTIKDSILNAEYLLNNIENSHDTVLDISNIIVNNNKKNTFCLFENGISENIIRSMEGSYQLSTAQQNEGILFKRYDRNGFAGFFVYKNGTWVEV